MNESICIQWIKRWQTGAYGAWLFALVLWGHISAEPWDIRNIWLSGGWAIFPGAIFGMFCIAFVYRRLLEEYFHLVFLSLLTANASIFLTIDISPDFWKSILSSSNSTDVSHGLMLLIGIATVFFSFVTGITMATIKEKEEDMRSRYDDFELKNEWNLKEARLRDSKIGFVALQLSVSQKVYVDLNLDSDLSGQKTPLIAGYFEPLVSVQINDPQKAITDIANAIEFVMKPSPGVSQDELVERLLEWRHGEAYLRALIDWLEHCPDFIEGEGEALSREQQETVSRSIKILQAWLSRLVF